MKKYIKSLLLAVLLVPFAFGLSAQETGTVSYTGLQGKKVADIIKQYFLGQGVELDESAPIYFNGKAVIESNQIAAFANTDTTYDGTNIPITGGLMLATCNATTINGGGSSSSPASDGNNVSPMLYYDYVDYTDNSNGCFVPKAINDVACLDFWVVPSSFEMSFKYSFASVEYQSYTCSDFNDIFGLYVDGPYENDRTTPCNDGAVYEYTNIATIPGTGISGMAGSGTKVAINTLNAGTTKACCSAYNDNNVHFIKNYDPKKNSKLAFTGWTRRLTTETVQTIPCKKYHIQISVANIADHGLQSAVYLEQGSFSAAQIVVDHKPAATNASAGQYMLKSCSTDTLVIRANYISDEQQTFPVVIKPSDGSSLVKGVDYDYVLDGTGVAVSDEVIIPIGDSIVKLILTLKHNPEKPAGTVDTLLFVGKDLTSYPCLTTDTIRLLLKEPDSMVCSVKGGKTLCEDKLPALDTVQITVKDAVSYGIFTMERGWGNERVLVETDTIRYEYGQTNLTLQDTFQIPITSPTDTAACHITVYDSCGRMWDTTVYYIMLGTRTKAMVSKDYICEGDTTQLSCPVSYKYQWSSSPMDTSLLADGKDTLQEPEVWPTKNTSYYIKITSEVGCMAYDTIQVNVEKLVKATMSLKPKDPKYSDPVIQFTDLTANAFKREWDFGDGNISEALQGQHAYAVDTTEDFHKYEVTLIAYNKAMCPDTTTDTVTVMADFTIYLPDAFIPGSGRGDAVALFGPKGALLEDWEMIIYNRWGTKIFQGTKQYWDGKLESGDWAPQGTYVYDIIYTDGKGRKQRTAGTVMLIPNNGSR
ncbi:MAG: choice-of-anchor L domain-containing protein [Bacteroidales bacterium]|nr:choice-of-anchor L domain-containing protein [Bacteroidales bacterium]